MKHLDEERLIQHYYGEDSQAADTKQHLGACAQCRADFDELSRVLAATADADIPDRGEDYGTQVWNRIRAHLPERPEPRPWWAWNSRTWAAAGAVAALLVAAFIAGRYYENSHKPAIAERPESVKERIVLVAVGEHLEQSQMFLLEVTHASSPKDLAEERDHAEQLVAANRLYRQSADKAAVPGVEPVLDELERVLVQIAHQPDDMTQAQLHDLQHQIESQGLLFKVRVIGSKVRNQGRSGPPKSRPPSKRQTT